MKKILSLLLALFVLFSLCACGGESGSNTDPNTLYAGFGRVTCVPDDPLVHIAGGTAKDDPATDGLLDTIEITCVSLKKGDDTYLIFTVDIVDVTGYNTTIENTIKKELGIDPANVIFNGTHTHSAPTLKPGDSSLPGAINYNIKFHDCSVDAARAAVADLSAVSEFSYGSIMTEDMVRVRHYLMNDGTTHGNGHGSAASGYKEHLYPADEECQVIKFTRPAEDKKDIIMFNLGAHATIVSGTHTSSLSADFPFPARTYIEEQGDYLCAYFIAAAGDQVPSSKISSEVKNKRNHYAYGEQLGGYVIECLEKNMTVSATNDITLYSENFSAKKLGSAPYTEGEIPKSSECQTLPTNTMTLGDIGLVFYPGEPFGSQGRYLKDNSPMFTFVITCSEDDQAYFPSPIAFQEGFYESKTTRFAEGAGEAIAARFVEILTAMKDGKTPEPQKLQ
ncbi:MAG: hypothetical protein IKU07_05045 [Oscillospiraceae bacterium]|nr:hypothetical protein [Oscillospiraceae bacterium]